MPLRQRYLDWRRPLLAAAADLLLQRHDGGNLDLRDTMIVVPTAHSGRRLREYLARRVAEQGGAVLPGAVVQPSRLLSSDTPDLPVAGRLETLAVWIEVLQELRPGDYANLFPAADNRTAAGEQELRRIPAIAAKLHRLRGALGEQGLSMQTVAALPDWEFETERWRELARLERIYLARLEQHGLQDLQTVQLRAAGGVQSPAGVERVLLLAVPDPLPLALQVLEAWSRRIEVEVVIHAPERLQAGFDDWGRPLPDYWEQAEIPLFDHDIRLAGKPAAQARQVLRVRPGFIAEPAAALTAGEVALGVLNPEVMPFLQQELEQKGVPAWNPAGVPCGSHYLTRMLAAFCELLDTGSYQALSHLVRCDTFLDLMQRREPGFEAETTLRQLDKLQNRHLPATFQRWCECVQDAADRPGASSTLKVVHDFLAPLVEQGTSVLTGALRELLQAAGSGIMLQSNRVEDREYLAVADQLVELIETCEHLEQGGFRLKPSDLRRLFRQELQTLKYQAEHSPGALELEGWLELPWNDAPYLLIAGMNDGLVPETVVGDPFLPDRARERLQLKNNRTRFTRDAYLLSALSASREQGAGGLQIIVGKHSNRGDPLRPSRLLFQCDTAHLSERVSRLFSEVSPETTESQAPAWVLQPRPDSHPGTLSVTAFRRYLNCPFRFYLSDVLGMTESNDRMLELTPAEFGSLCHRVLQEFAADPVRDSEDEREIAAYLIKRAAAWMYHRFGREWPAALQIQFEVAKRRLTRAAAIQAEQRQQGWRLIAAEREFTAAEGFQIAGATVTGTIDRIERHADGRLRLLDYKTGGREFDPFKTHLVGVSPQKAAALPDYSCITSGKKQYVWCDLQLPLYHAMLRAADSKAPLCGYFALPADPQLAGVHVWEEADPWLEAALVCAEGVAREIRRGCFWPPRDKPRFDAFGEFFPHGPRADVTDAAAALLSGEREAEA